MKKYKISDLAHQMKLAESYEYSKKFKKCVYRLPQDFGLTPYGRERARFCEGGFDGCSGPCKMVVIDAGKKSEYKALRCDSCGTKTSGEMLSDPSKQEAS